MTDPAKGDPAAQDEARRRRQKIQRQLDEALEASFPASDPVSIVTSHEEEDWGVSDAPPPPGKPAP
jgi:2-methylcitrate dehydratase PrpD